MAGMIEYCLHPELGASFGGPFNGQQSRAELFLEMVECLSPVALIETGTYRGATAEFLAALGLPIYTIENHPRAYGFASLRLRKWQNVKPLRGDSRDALVKLLMGPLRDCARETLFFYLDAHKNDLLEQYRWQKDPRWHDNALPLADELQIIFARCPAAVVMIDDFEVVDDPAYGFDDYGPDVALTIDYIKPAMAAYDLLGFYPATPSSMESGARRGCIVLARRAVHGATLTSLPLLRPASGQWQTKTLA